MMTAHARMLRPGRAATLLALSLTFAACRCNDGTARRFPEITVAPTLVDFGTQQVNLVHEQSLRITNNGAATLNISAFRTQPPFGVEDAAPLSIGAGEQRDITLTFEPTVADKRYTDTLVVVSDDPENPEVSVDLAGAGIGASATAMPATLAFGDVWVGEQKTLTLTIRNGGTNTLDVRGAQFLEGSPSTVTASLTPISEDIPAGGQTQTQVTFAPTEMSENMSGGIRLELDPLQGGELIVPFSGRGVRALPRLCFQLEGAPMETCTASNPTPAGGGNITVAFPPLCDALVNPPDAGPQTACEGAPYSMNGRLYVRNEGNVPVQYSLQYKAATVTTSCDGGVLTQPDFAFSNAPDAGTLQWAVPTTQLPAMPGDPKPWETAPVTVTYSPTAECPDQASDQAQIFWTRQGDTRQPVILSAFLTGQSRLPDAVPHDVAVQGQAGSHVPVHGADNRGIAEFQVTQVRLFEVVNPSPQAACTGPDAGPFQECDGSNPSGYCSHWEWADGGNPNLTAPHTIPVGADGGIGTVRIGTLVFAPSAGSTLNTPYCVYTVADTTDPFHPQIVSRVQGTQTQ